MIPWTALGETEIPGGGKMRLIRRGDEFAIMLGAEPLMNSRLSGSEEAMAGLALAPLGQITAPRVLIGGLGMGFTLRAALPLLQPGAQVVVAELVASVVDWARGPMAELFAGCLDDPRVRVEVADVAALIRARAGAYHAILLDVDNGSDGLTTRANDWLYKAAGLAAIRAALAPRGLVAFWSAAPDAAFGARLKAAGFEVEERRVKAHRGRAGARHVIWLGARPASAGSHTPSAGAKKQ